MRYNITILILNSQTCRLSSVNAFIFSHKVHSNSYDVKIDLIIKLIHKNVVNIVSFKFISEMSVLIMCYLLCVIFSGMIKTIISNGFLFEYIIVVGVLYFGNYTFCVL